MSNGTRGFSDCLSMARFISQSILSDWRALQPVELIQWLWYWLLDFDASECVVLFGTSDRMHIYITCWRLLFSIPFPEVNKCFPQSLLSCKGGSYKRAHISLIVSRYVDSLRYLGSKSRQPWSLTPTKLAKMLINFATACIPLFGWRLDIYWNNCRWSSLKHLWELEIHICFREIRGGQLSLTTSGLKPDHPPQLILCICVFGKRTSIEPKIKIWVCCSNLPILSNPPQQPDLWTVSSPSVLHDSSRFEVEPGPDPSLQLRLSPLGIQNTIAVLATSKIPCRVSIVGEYKSRYPIVTDLELHLLLLYQKDQTEVAPILGYQEWLSTGSVKRG